MKHYKSHYIPIDDNFVQINLSMLIFKSSDGSDFENGVLHMLIGCRKTSGGSDVEFLTSEDAGVNTSRI